MSANDSLKQIYTKFYEQKEVLSDAPALSQAPNVEPFDFNLADAELIQLISWFLGVADIRNEPFQQILTIIQEHYDSQPAWKELLVQYFRYSLEKEREQVQAQQNEVLKEIEDFANDLLEKEKKDG